jgi:hypothetical protein
MSAISKLHTLGEVARLIRAPEWKIRQLLREGLVTEPARCGITRAFRAEDLAAIRKAMSERFPVAGKRTAEPAAAVA